MSDINQMPPIKLMFPDKQTQRKLTFCFYHMICVSCDWAHLKTGCTCKLKMGVMCWGVTRKNTYSNSGRKWMILGVWVMLGVWTTLGARMRSTCYPLNVITSDKVTTYMNRMLTVASLLSNSNWVNV